jgi:AraC family transcriptional regulator
MSRYGSDKADGCKQRDNSFAYSPSVATVVKLKAQFDAGGAQRAYVEALGIALAHELARLNDAGASPAEDLRGGLPGWQQNRLTQYIEEHLADEVSLASLAHLVQLSPYHFSRAFKQSFGVPPHRYLTDRRIERAKRLLAQRQLTRDRIAPRFTSLPASMIEGE